MRMTNEMELDFYNWFLVFVRLGAFLLALPFFSAVNFPATMRVALAALAALLLAPQLPPFAISHLDLLALVRPAGAGNRHRPAVRLFCADGFLRGGHRGHDHLQRTRFEHGQPHGPDCPASRNRCRGLILFFLATITMLSLDLHHGLLLGFAKSFEVLPLGGGHLSSPPCLKPWWRAPAQIFVIALQIAAPVMAVSFCITVFFAVMSRAVPQMNVFAESFGIRIAGGLIVLGFTLQIAAQYIVNHLHRLPDDLLGLGQMLGGGK